MFVFLMFYASIVSCLAILFYSQIGIEKEKTEVAKHEAEYARQEKESIQRWHNSSQPVKDLEAALYKVAALERENKDLKEQLEKVSFENEELKKASHPKNYVLHTEHFNELL